MQYCDITLCLSGDIAFQVEKPNVSVAEIALLRELHGGADAIRNVRSTERRRDPMHLAKRALIEKYAHSPKTVEVIERLWPGLSPNLPKTLADIGLELDPSTMDTRERRGPQRVTFAPADPDDDGEGDDGSSYEAEDRAREEAEKAAGGDAEGVKPAPALAAAMERGRALARAGKAG